MDITKNNWRKLQCSTNSAKTKFQAKKMATRTLATIPLKSVRCDAKAKGESIPNGTCRRILLELSDY
jgi:hypothetical protein